MSFIKMFVLILYVVNYYVSPRYLLVSINETKVYISNDQGIYEPKIEISNDQRIDEQNMEISNEQGIHDVWVEISSDKGINERKIEILNGQGIEHGMKQNTKSTHTKMPRKNLKRGHKPKRNSKRGSKRERKGATTAISKIYLSKIYNRLFH